MSARALRMPSGAAPACGAVCRPGAGARLAAAAGSPLGGVGDSDEEAGVAAQPV